MSKKGISVHMMTEGTVIESPSQKYVIVRVLGQGAFGMVFEAVRESDNSSTAIKITEKQDSSYATALYQSYKNELTLMGQINNDHIVSLQDNWEDELNCYLAMQYCNGGTLTHYVEKNGYQPENKAIQMLLQILSGMKALHESQKRVIAHRDLKPDNILLDNDMLVIADLGLSKEIKDGKQIMETIAGTPLYMAPEILKCEPYTYECDVYSLGCILYFIVYGQPPYVAQSQYKLVMLLESQIGKAPDLEVNFIQTTDPFKQLVSHMLQVQPQDRIKFKDLYEHPLFKANPFQDRYLQDVQNVQIKKGTFVNQSKMYASNIKEAIINKDSKGALEGLKGFGSMLGNKLKKSYLKQEEKLKDLLGNYKKNKEDEKIIMKIINLYVDKMNTFGILGQAAKEIHVRSSSEKNSQKKMKYLIAEVLLYKKVQNLYQILQINMQDKNYSINKVECIDKLFSDKLFVKLCCMVQETLQLVKEEIDKLILEIKKTPNVSIDNKAQIEISFPQELQMKNQNQFSDFIKIYLKEYYFDQKKEVNLIGGNQNSQQNIEKRIYNHLHLIARAITFDMHFLFKKEENEMLFEQYRKNMQKITITNLKCLVESLEQQF